MQGGKYNKYQILQGRTYNLQNTNVPVKIYETLQGRLSYKYQPLQGRKCNNHCKVENITNLQI